MLGKNLAGLIKVKSIVTIVLTLVFSYLAVIGSITGSEFLTIFATIIAFYYGTQHEKQEVSENKEETK